MYYVVTSIWFSTYLIRPTSTRRPADVCPADFLYYLKDSGRHGVGAVSPKKVRGRFFQRPALLTAAAVALSDNDLFLTHNTYTTHALELLLPVGLFRLPVPADRPASAFGHRRRGCKALSPPDYLVLTSINMALKCRKQ